MGKYYTAVIDLVLAGGFIVALIVIVHLYTQEPIVNMEYTNFNVQGVTDDGAAYLGGRLTHILSQLPQRTTQNLARELTGSKETLSIVRKDSYTWIKEGDGWEFDQWSITEWSLRRLIKFGFTEQIDWTKIRHITTSAVGKKKKYTSGYTTYFQSGNRVFHLSYIGGVGLLGNGAALLFISLPQDTAGVMIQKELAGVAR